MPTDPAPHLAALLLAEDDRWLRRAGWRYSPEYRPLDGVEIHVEAGGGDLIHWHVTARADGVIVAYDESPPCGTGEQAIVDALCVMVLPAGTVLPREHHSLYRAGVHAGYVRGYAAGLRVGQAPGGVSGRLSP